ncbi:MAG: glycosyltransferase family 4 protein [Desulfovibrionaceae bacterium]|nr:glycosyltransferase family 4 protein [Desulfovibrionaceae bacterium]
MRIGVNARVLDYESGGAKEYLISLLGALLAVDQGNRYVLFHTDKKHFGRFPGAEEVSLGVSNRLVFDWLKLPGALSRHKIDLAFFPFSNMCPAVGRPSVVTMLDLGYFVREYRMYRLPDTIYMRYAIRRAARRATRLIAISEATRRDLTRITGAPAHKTHTIHLAPDAMYSREVSPGETAAFRARHGLARDFFLYTGNISPRKNLRALLAAFAQAASRCDFDLALTGGTAWGADFEDWVRGLGLQDRVRKLGFIVREQMPALYKSAAVFVFPTLFEGFGLPVLEAQAQGVQVLCSNTTSLPEVAGDSAYLVDPRSVEAIAEGLVRLACDPGRRAELSAKGLANVRRFSWETAARQTLDVFRQAAGR